MSLKRKDQSVRRLDFVDVSLDTFDLKPANSWDLLTSGAEYFPADAESVLVSFVLITENRDKVAVEGEQKAFVAIRLLTDTGQLLQSKQAETLSRDQSTEASPYTFAVALDEVKSALGSVKIKVNTRVENLSAREETFASLGHIYDFRKTAADEDESIKLAKTVSLTPVNEYLLYPNYPNPFNPVTTIRYALPERAQVDLAVYDIQGRLIRRLVSGVREAGQHEAQWDGRDANGRAAASGVYLYKLSTNQGFTQTRKLLLLK